MKYVKQQRGCLTTLCGAGREAYGVRVEENASGAGGRERDDGLCAANGQAAATARPAGRDEGERQLTVSERGRSQLKPFTMIVVGKKN